MESRLREEGDTVRVSGGFAGDLPGGVPGSGGDVVVSRNACSSSVRAATRGADQAF